MFDQIAGERTDAVFEYLGSGNPANSTDAAGVPLIRWCAYCGDVSAVRLLLAKGESLDALGVNFDLNGASFHGHWQLRQFLIEQGADVNRTLPGTLETPLHAAFCKSGQPVFDLVAHVLLAAAADPNSTTAPAVPTGRFMRDRRTKAETPLHRAAAYGSENAIQMLLDARDMHGDSPLLGKLASTIGPNPGDALLWATLDSSRGRAAIGPGTRSRLAGHEKKPGGNSHPRSRYTRIPLVGIKLRVPRRGFAELGPGPRHHAQPRQ